jgi:hypothetical protein
MDRIVKHDHPARGEPCRGRRHRQGAEYLSARQNPDGQPSDITPEQRAQVQKTSRNARQAMRVARRLGRF